MIFSTKDKIKEYEKSQLCSKMVAVLRKLDYWKIIESEGLKIVKIWDSQKLRLQIVKPQSVGGSKRKLTFN